MANSHDDPTDTVYLGVSEMEELIKFYKAIRARGKGKEPHAP